MGCVGEDSGLSLGRRQRSSGWLAARAGFVWVLACSARLDSLVVCVRGRQTASPMFPETAAKKLARWPTQSCSLHRSLTAGERRSDK